MRRSAFVYLVPALTALLPWAAADAAARLVKVDHRNLVSRADITYDKPVTRSEEGLPVGNGRMGSLVWTTPAALKFQINRPDVFAVNSSTCSFPRRNTDYASGCGYVDINLVDYGEDVFAGAAFRQHLGVYDGLMTAEGNGVTVRVLAWHERDVIAVEIEDRRKKPAPVNVDLRMLRYMMQYFPGKNFELSSRHAVMVQTAAHTATSRLDIRNGRIILTQEFRENDYYNASAVAIGIVGRETKARYFNELTVRLSAAPDKGRFTILMASASSFDPKQDVAALALKELDVAAAKGFRGLLASNKTWWHDFWSRTFVHLHSEDGVADYVEKNYTYFLYVMASSSRGDYPPRYGGMIWYTTGDMREWGSQHWWWNSSCYYNALPPVNRFELMDPMFSMYSGMYESCALAARQQWGSRGIWLSETTWFDGLAKLPEDIAAEMRELYLVRKPWEQRSERFRWFAGPKLKHNARWNWATVGRWEQGHWVVPDKGRRMFGHVTHMFSSTARISFLYWLRYEYTQDKVWLRDRAYPMLKGTVEFYRNFPNVEKGADGKYHIYHTNNHEAVWDAQDTLEDVSAIRGITPILIRASELLDVDADMRPLWREFVENFAPLPTSDILGPPRSCLRQEDAGDEPRHWISAVPPARSGNPERPDLVPALLYDLCTVGTADPQMLRTGNATFEAIYSGGINEKTPVHTLTPWAAAAAYLGRANDLKHMVPNQIRCLTPDKDFCDWVGAGRTGVLPNRLTLREGPGAIDCQRLGRAAEALHAALLQSVPPAPGKDPVIHIFPAWPREWDAAYTLLARGAFLVSASIEKGRIDFVEIQSQVGGECRLRNPWPDAALTLYRNGKKAGDLSGSLPAFPTARGETVTVVRRGSMPVPTEISVLIVP